MPTFWVPTTLEHALPAPPVIEKPEASVGKIRTWRLLHAPLIVVTVVVPLTAIVGLTGSVIVPAEAIEPPILSTPMLPLITAVSLFGE